MTATPEPDRRPPRRSPARPPGAMAPPGPARLPVVLAAVCGLLLFSLPLLLPSAPSGERLKIRRELRKF